MWWDSGNGLGRTVLELHQIGRNTVGQFPGRFARLDQAVFFPAFQVQIDGTEAQGIGFCLFPVHVGEKLPRVVGVVFLKAQIPGLGQKTVEVDRTGIGAYAVVGTDDQGRLIVAGGQGLADDPVHFSVMIVDGQTQLGSKFGIKRGDGSGP